MKDSGYTMKIMSTYGSLLVKDGQRDSIRTYTNAAGQNVTKKFKYTEPFANHFLYRHCVDDHNNLRHAGVSIEETWRTHRWVNRVFAFLLAISEVNTFLAFRSFVWDEEDKMELLHFRRLLALALINNEWRGDENQESHATRKRRMKHTLTTAPIRTTQFWAENGFARRNQRTSSTSAVVKSARNRCEVIVHVHPGTGYVSIASITMYSTSTRLFKKY
jgi:hypothetical protein